MPSEKKTLEEKVNQIIVDLLGVNSSNITPQSEFRYDLGADSLDLIEMIMAVEFEFHIEISDDEVRDIENVGQVYKYLKDKGLS